MTARRGKHVTRMEQTMDARHGCADCDADIADDQQAVRHVRSTGHIVECACEVQVQWSPS